MHVIGRSGSRDDSTSYAERRDLSCLGWSSGKMPVDKLSMVTAIQRLPLSLALPAMLCVKLMKSAGTVVGD